MSSESAIAALLSLLSGQGDASSAALRGQVLETVLRIIAGEAPALPAASSGLTINFYGDVLVVQQAPSAGETHMSERTEKARQKAHDDIRRHVGPEAERLHAAIERLFAGAAGSDPALEARRQVALGLLDLLFAERSARSAGVHVSNVGGDVTIHIGNTFADDVRRFLADARPWIAELPEDKRAEMTGRIDEIVRETQGPQPRRGVIGEMLASVRRIAESAGGGLAAETLKAMVNSLAA